MNVVLSLNCFFHRINIFFLIILIIFNIFNNFDGWLLFVCSSCVNHQFCFITCFIERIAVVIEEKSKKINMNILEFPPKNYLSGVCEVSTIGFGSAFPFSKILFSVLFLFSTCFLLHMISSNLYSD